MWGRSRRVWRALGSGEDWGRGRACAVWVWLSPALSLIKQDYRPSMTRSSTVSLPQKSQKSGL